MALRKGAWKAGHLLEVLERARAAKTISTSRHKVAVTDADPNVDSGRRMNGEEENLESPVEMWFPSVAKPQTSR